MKKTTPGTLSEFTQKTLAQCIQGNQQYPDFRTLCGILKVEQNRLADSRKDFVSAIRSNANYIQPLADLHYLNLLSSGRIKAGSIQALVLKLTQAPKKAPLEHQLFVLKLLLLKGNFGEASQIFHSLNKKFPSNPKLIFLNGVHDFFTGRNISALKKIKTALRASPYLGKQLDLSRKSDLFFNSDSLKTLLKEMLRRAFIIPVRAQMAAFCAARGDFHTAGRYLEEIQKLDPDSYDAWNIAGDLAHAAGREKTSIRCYEQAQEADPFRADPAIKLSFIYGKKRDLKRAFSVLQHCLSNNPRYPDLHHYLAENQIARKKHALAEKHLLKALSLNPYYSAALYSLAELYEKQRKFDQSLKTYLKAISLSMAPRHLVSILIAIHKKSTLSKTQSLARIVQKSIRRSPSSAPLKKLLSML